MNPDDELLNRNNSGSAEKVGALKEAQRGGTENNNSAQPLDFKATTQAAKTEQKTKEEKPTGALVKAVTAPASKATGNLLQQCWLNIIDSWGLTLIWINIHVFLGIVLGHKLFCKLGEEWVPTVGVGAGENSGEIKEVGKMAGLVESMGLAGLDAVGLALIFFFFAIAALVANLLENPFQIIWMVITGKF